jgi:hypothetical protein
VVSPASFGIAVIAGVFLVCLAAVGGEVLAGSWAKITPEATDRIHIHIRILIRDYSF